MTRLRYMSLVVQAWWHLLRFDLLHRFGGFGRVQHRLAGSPVRPAAPPPDVEHTICDAVLLATCLYWKPVLCLQRSFCVTILLRRCGVAASLVIGFRPMPFLAHAWVAVDRRIVNDSSAYAERLGVLHTI
jgi:hypothetical protein